MKSDPPVQPQAGTLWKATDPQFWLRGSTSGAWRTRVSSSRSRSIVAVISPWFVLVPVYSLLLFAAWPNSGAFWILPNPASSDNPVTSSCPELSTMNEPCSAIGLSLGGSLVICCPTLWCSLETHSSPTSTSHVCALVDPLFIFTFCGLKTFSVTGLDAASMSAITSANFLDVELSLKAAVIHLAKTIGGVSFNFASDTASFDGFSASVSRYLFLDLYSLLDGVDSNITEAASFSGSSSSVSCLPSSLVSSTVFSFLVLGIKIILTIILISSLLLALALTFLNYTLSRYRRAVFTVSRSGVWPRLPDMNHLASKYFPATLSSPGSPNSTTMSHSSSLNSWTSNFCSTFRLKSVKNCCHQSWSRVLKNIVLFSSKMFFSLLSLLKNTMLMTAGWLQSCNSRFFRGGPEGGSPYRLFFSTQVL